MGTYGYSSAASSDVASTSASHMNEAVLFVVIALAIVLIIMDLIATNMFIDIAIDKGHFRDNVPTSLWLIGIFTTPITVGLYVLALPDKRNQGKAISEQPRSEVPPMPNGLSASGEK